VWSRVSSVTTPDPDGAGSQTASVTSYTYDRWHGVATITDPSTGGTNFTYDPLGRLTNLQDASANDTSWTYDGLGRATGETNELAKTRYFAYDASGNLVRKTDRSGRTTRYTYDGLDRLTDEKWYSGGTVPTASAITTTQGGPTNEVQRVGYSGAMGGSFTLTYSGQTTSSLAYNASANDVLAALEALSNIGSGDVAVTQTVNTTSAKEWQVTFQGALAASNVSQITISTAGLFPSASATEATDTQGSSSNNEVQSVTISNATGGTFRLTFGTEQTSAIAYDASAGNGRNGPRSPHRHRQRHRDWLSRRSLHDHLRRHAGQHQRGPNHRRRHLPDQRHAGSNAELQLRRREPIDGCGRPRQRVCLHV
jgi:YD repeat-containing protein